MLSQTHLMTLADGSRKEPTATTRNKYGYTEDSITIVDGESLYVPPDDLGLHTYDLAAMSAKNGQWFDIEMDKLDRWAEDRRAALKADLEELDQAIKDAKKFARLAPNLPEKLEFQRKLRGLETKRDEAWRAYDSASRDVDRQKDSLLDEISRRLQQQTSCEELFTLRWRVAWRK